MNIWVLSFLVWFVGFWHSSERKGFRLESCPAGYYCHVSYDIAVLHIWFLCVCSFCITIECQMETSMQLWGGVFFPGNEYLVERTVQYFCCSYEFMGSFSHWQYQWWQCSAPELVIPKPPRLVIIQYWAHWKKLQAISRQKGEGLSQCLLHSAVFTKKRNLHRMHMQRITTMAMHTK